MSGATMTEKRKGRPPFITKARRQRIIQAYKVHRSYRIVGQLCDVSHQAVSNIIKDAGMDPKDYPKHRVILETEPNYSAGSFAEWMYKHDFAKLPRSLKQIAYISGHSYNAVAMFFSRNRRRVIERFHKLPTLYGKGLVLEDEKSEQFLVDELDDLKYLVDKFSMHVAISARDLRGITHRFPIEDIRYFEEAVNRLDQTGQIQYGRE